jgi:hypothetical protein
MEQEQNKQMKDKGKERKIYNLKTKIDKLMNKKIRSKKPGMQKSFVEALSLNLIVFRDTSVRLCIECADIFIICFYGFF